MKKSFTFSREIITNGRIILVDEPLSLEMCSQLKNLKTTDDQELLFIEDSSLAVNLEEILNGIVINEQDILFVFPELFLITNVKTIIVVDDVISSGLTIRKLYEKNSWRFTQAKWIATSWISQNLENGIKGYEQIKTSLLVKKEESSGKVPINSLSTLRNNSEIAKSYAERHFKKPEMFLKILIE